jgi:hypothetical protein
MAVLRAALLLAVGRASLESVSSTMVLGGSPLVHLVDPLAGQIDESSEVLGSAQPLRLEPAHLTDRRRRPGDRPIAERLAHCRVAAQPVGAIHFLVAGEPPEHRLTQQARQQVTDVLSGGDR